MTLKRRILIWLSMIAPLIWLVAIVAAWFTSRHEIDELFDTQQVKLAQQVLATLSGTGFPDAVPQTSRALVESQARQGNADPADMAIGAWTLTGRRLTPLDPGVDLPFDRSRAGFATPLLAGRDWRVYTLIDEEQDRVVAVGVRAAERREVLYKLVLSNLLPWLLSLPLLLFAIALVLERELRPLRDLANEVAARGANDLQPLANTALPADIAPLVASTNQLFARIGVAIEHERRLTADAAHELRTPIAGLRAQWDAFCLAANDADRARAATQIGAGLDRLSRLVSQLLSLSALEVDGLRRSFVPVQWSRVLANAIDDVLPIIENKKADLSVDWPADGVAALPLEGDEALLGMMLRNLLDNAVRHGPDGAKLVVRFSAGSVSVIDEGPGLPAEVLARVGERFVRPPGQKSAGSGIGLSIVMRIAQLHRLAIEFEPGDGGGLVVRIARTA